MGGVRSIFWAKTAPHALHLFFFLDNGSSMLTSTQVLFVGSRLLKVSAPPPPLVSFSAERLCDHLRSMRGTTFVLADC